jgi:mannosyltransferase OCH1-like enzyme
MTHLIPKKIHQIWVGPLPPPSRLMATWKRMHPGWEYKVWTDHKTGWENQSQIDAMPEWNGKADIMRWEILEREGGVLVDADSECVRPLEDVFLDHESFACWENETVRPGLIAAGYVGAAKGSPLMRKCIDAVKHRPLIGTRAWQSVGPLLLTEMAEGYEALHVFPARMFIPTHCTGTTAPGDAVIYANQYWGSTLGYDKMKELSVEAIPKIVHHVWPGHDVFRSEFHDFRSSWMRHHPDWTFFFWRLEAPFADDEVVRLLADDRYTVVVKSDILRLAVLLEYGGIYTDTDVECIKAFDSLLLDPNGFFCGTEDGSYLCPTLMGAVPQHPFVRDLLHEALQRVRTASVDDCNRSPNEVSGPHLLTHLARGRKDVTVHPREWFYPIRGSELHRLGEATPLAYAKHYWNGTTSPNGWTRKMTFGKKEVDAGNEVFRGWYTPGGHGSGIGSTPEYTRRYRQFLEQFMVENAIESVLDYGCGDWQSTKLVDWGTRMYFGVDIVPGLIERLQREYGGPNRNFSLIDSETCDLPLVDLVVCKDVIQHLSNSDALACIGKLQRLAKHVLWINDLGLANEDIARGGYRPMALDKSPFLIAGHTVFEFGIDPHNKIVWWQPGDRLTSNVVVAPALDIKFDLGGIGARAGYKTVNLVESCDVKCDITDLNAFCVDGTVSEFLLSHTLEHVPVEEYETFLRALWRKLKSGGIVRIVQTDADKVIRQYTRGELSFRSMRSTLFTPPDRLVGNPHQSHKNMWSAEELSKDLRAVGFQTCLFDAGGWSMDMTDPFYSADVHADHGKFIANLGVIGTKA